MEGRNCMGNGLRQSKEEPKRGWVQMPRMSR